MGITTAVTLGITLLAAGPAHAAPNDVRIVASGNVDLTVGGGTRRVVFTVSNAGPMDADNISVRVDVPLGGDGVGVAQGPDGCEVGRNHVQCAINRLKRGDAEQLAVQIAPPQSGGPAPGESRSEQGVARVEVGEDANPGNNAAGFRVTLRGPEAAKVVKEISGTVRDGESDKPMSGARVLVTDAKSQSHRTTTDDTGQFRLTSAEGEPIAAGTVQIAVSKQGYETRKLRRTVDSGGSVTLRVSLSPKVTASASATGDPTASEKAAIPPTESGEESDSGGWLIWMLYLFAALLVMGGIGAIVWLFVRRNEDDDNETYGPGRPGGPGGPGGFGGPGGPPGPPGPGAPPIGAHGVYHDPYGSPTAVMGGGQPTRMLGADSPTSVLGPGGLSGAMDQPTSVIGPGGLSRGMDQPTSYMPRPGMDQPTSRIPSSGIDEPTQAHPGPLADDDDVYPHGRDVYADGTGRQGYGDPGYGRGQGYGDPGYQSDQGYGGYGAGPTSGGGGYGTGPTSGSGGYGSGGYGQDPGYGSRPASGGGHHSAPPTSGGGYGAAPASGGGYGAGPTSGGGYGTGQAPDGDYGQQGYGEQQSRRGRRAAEDRRLDWYED